MSFPLAVLVLAVGGSLVVFAWSGDLVWRLGSFVALTLVGFFGLLGLQWTQGGPLLGLLVLMAVGAVITVILVLLGLWLRRELQRQTGESGPDVRSQPHE